MSMNHDDQLLHKVERLVDHGLPVHDDLLTDLADNKPIPDDRHRDTLEAQLMAIAYQQHKEQPTMDMPMPNKQKNKQRRFRIPTTYAAVLAILLVGASVFFMMPNGTNPSQLIFGSQYDLQQDQPTPVPIITATVVPTATIDDFGATATQLISMATSRAMTTHFTPTMVPADMASSGLVQIMRLQRDDLMMLDRLEGVSIGDTVNVFAVFLAADLSQVNDLDNTLSSNLRTALVTESQNATVTRIINDPQGNLQVIELSLDSSDATVLEWLVNNGVALLTVPE